jgi:hypothetical protein
MDFAIYAQLTQSARDKLGHLAAKINNKQALVLGLFHAFAHMGLFRLVQGSQLRRISGILIFASKCGVNIAVCRFSPSRAVKSTCLKCCVGYVSLDLKLK